MVVGGRKYTELNSEKVAPNPVCSAVIIIIIIGSTALRGLPQKLLPAIVSDYCFFRFHDKILFQCEVVSPTPNPRLSWRADVFFQGCFP
jgi:hypothetical protein